MALGLLCPTGMRVDELMSRDVKTIGADESCYAAAMRMAQIHIHHLPVLDSAGCLVGIVTDRDLRQRLFAPHVFSAIGAIPIERLFKDILVREVMSAPVVTVRSAAVVEAAARLMRDGKLGALPVLEAGRVVGIITETDILRQIVKDDAFCRDVGTVMMSSP
jgi:acetoin utilization protein AcuB